MNDSDTIQAAFSDYYRTTILSDETDPNKLHDLKADLDGRQVYAQADIDNLVALYLGGADRDRLDPILDACVATYKEQLDEDGQVEFKGKAKAFTRSYDFLASILPYTNADWEKLSIFLNFLVPKLPAPVDDDLAKGILESIDMDSYRVEKLATVKFQLPDEDAEIEPVSTAGGGGSMEPETRSPLQYPRRLQRPVRQHRLDRHGPRQPAHHDRDPGPGGRRWGVPERVGELRQAERPHRARQGAGPRDDRPPEGRHRAVQAVQRQRLVPAVADRYGVWADLRGVGRQARERPRETGPLGQFCSRTAFGESLGKPLGRAGPCPEVDNLSPAQWDCCDRLAAPGQELYRGIFVSQAARGKPG